jgi:hypothetical protein
VRVHHATARNAITRILAGSGFGESALVLTLATRLHDDPDCPEHVRQRLIERCLECPVDEAPPYVHPINQQPIPDDEKQICQQLLPALIAHPADTAQSTAALWALTQLWSHVATDERALLRTRFLNTLAMRRDGEADASLSAFQLREWQKQVPTHYGTLTPSVASLRGVLETDNALAAYLLLAEHLGMTVDLETLCWVLGSLGIQLLQSNHDRSGRLSGIVLGASACERLAAYTQAETLVTVISQLNHRIWWLKAHGGLHRIRQSIDHTQRPFGPAVATGDITLAQRAARTTAAQQPSRFWSEAWRQAGEHLPSSRRDLLRILALMDTARWRSDNGTIAIDDAAAIAAVLSDIAWRERTPQP